MRFLPMSELLDDALRGGYAVPAFCVWDMEVAVAVLRVARRLNSPVILMNGPGEFPLLRPADLGAGIRAVAERFNVTAALHLDHGDSLELVRECIAAGYTSVMLDYSARSYSKNAEAMKTVVQMAKPLGITVEGELGKVGRVDDSATEGSTSAALTDPEAAERFVAETGIDALAVAIGNAHGQYTALPQLDFDLLAELHSRLSIPLVLHGGTGTPEADLRRAVSLGIAKVNIATDLFAALRTSLLAQWREDAKLVTPSALANAMTSVETVAEGWIRRLGAEGKSAG